MDMRSIKGFLRDNWVITIFGGLTVILISYYIFGVGKNSNGDIYNVSSQYQKGGITTAKVEIMTIPSRHLDEDTTSWLHNQLKDEKGITLVVLSTVGDGEASQFALEIANYLNSHRWIVRPNVGVFLAPEYSLGLHTKKDGDQMIIYVGTHER